MHGARLNIHSLIHQLNVGEPRTPPTKELNEISDFFSGTCSDRPLTPENEQLVASKCQTYLSPSDLQNRPHNMRYKQDSSLQDLAHAFHCDGNSYAAQVILKNVFLYSPNFNTDRDNPLSEVKAQCWAKVQLGDLKAPFEFGCLLFIEGNINDGMMYFQEAAMEGNTDAKLYLGLFYSLAGQAALGQEYIASIDQPEDVHSKGTSHVANFVLGHRHHIQWLKSKNEDDFLTAQHYFRNSAKDGYQPAIDFLTMHLVDPLVDFKKMGDVTPKPTLAPYSPHEDF